MAPKRPKTTFPARLEDSRALFFRDDDKYARLLYARVRYENFFRRIVRRASTRSTTATPPRAKSTNDARDDEHTRLDTRGHTKSVAREKKDLGNERDNNKGARFLSASNCVE
tara:strand:- start:2803 stop:3138 length:336 start_codon:yes stop_codon:yes gene_type:complete